jgi:FkbM family methyltransferase
MNLFINFIRNILKSFDIGITRLSRLEKLNKNIPYYIPATLSAKSKSQLRQDLFVLSYLSFKKDGYFVEFGATNGVDLSNTFLMEKEFGWNGILAEPAKIWHKDLKKNRCCNIETDCVWKDSNSILAFNEVNDAELSTIDIYSAKDLHKDTRKQGKIFEVKTISLIDLLKKYNAPKSIDYLSIDTEGSEWEILSHFDFSEYSFDVITCEHNFTPMREKLYVLLTKHGYQRVFEELSSIDDWYIKIDRNNFRYT